MVQAQKTQEECVIAHRSKLLTTMCEKLTSSCFHFGRIFACVCHELTPEQNGHNKIEREKIVYQLLPLLST